MENLIRVDDIKKALYDYDQYNSRWTKSLRMACNRIIDTAEVKSYLNRSGVKVVGNIGRFYVSDECRIINSEETIKRLVTNDKVRWFPEDHYKYDTKKGNWKILKYEYGEDKKKFAIIKIMVSQRVLNHRVGDVVPSTNQLFIKIPVLREKVNGVFKLVNNNDLVIKNIKCKLSLDEFDAWINCDVDGDENDAPYYTVKSADDYSEEYIKLCIYLNKKLNLNIDVEDYARRYNQDIQESDTSEE